MCVYVSVVFFIFFHIYVSFHFVFEHTRWNILSWNWELVFKLAAHVVPVGKFIMICTRRAIADISKKNLIAVINSAVAPFWELQIQMWIIFLNFHQVTVCTEFDVVILCFSSSISEWRCLVEASQKQLIANFDLYKMYADSCSFCEYCFYQ